MVKDYIGYEALTESALRSVIREALRRTQKQGLIGSHHFYITFKTHAPGVAIPDFLKERYPDDMTIVLQNQFFGLKVEDDSFEVGLSFQKMPATLTIPFAAITSFLDRGVQFALQFRTVEVKAPAETNPPGDIAALPAPEPAKPPEPAPRAEAPVNEAPQVVSLDKFRKK